MELTAYLNAKVHMFLLPGEANREEIINLVAANLAKVGALAVARRPNVYWLMRDGVMDYERRLATLARKRRRPK